MNINYNEKLINNEQQESRFNLLDNLKQILKRKMQEIQIDLKEEVINEIAVELYNRKVLNIETIETIEINIELKELFVKGYKSKQLLGVPFLKVIEKISDLEKYSEQELNEIFVLGFLINDIVVLVGESIENHKVEVVVAHFNEFINNLDTKNNESIRKLLKKIIEKNKDKTDKIICSALKK